MSHLLDTCVLSEPTRPRPAVSVLEWLRHADPNSLYISVLTLGELESGVERLPDSTRKRRLRHWLGTVRAASHSRVLSIDDPVATEWGRMTARAAAQGDVLPVVDALLGTTAIVHGLTVITRKTSDISRTGATIFDPWRF